jgi:hypothetical protein
MAVGQVAVGLVGVGLMAFGQVSATRLELKFPNGVPVIFHNLSNYDLQLFIKVLSKNAKMVDIIPKNEERIITAIAKFEGIKLKVRFIDSFRFMSASLDSLAKNLNLEDLINVKKQLDPK